MKKIGLYLIVFCLFCFCYINKVYAEDLSVIQRIERKNDNFMRNENVVKITSYIKSGWDCFKKWLGNFPGIKNLEIVKNNNRSYLQKDSDGANPYREDKENWDNKIE